MTRAEYKKVVEEAKRYIEAGKPLAAAHIHEQHATKFTEKQYYDLLDMVYKALTVR